MGVGSDVPGDAIVSEHELSLVGGVALIAAAGFVFITLVRAFVSLPRKRIGFRVQIDTPVRGEPPTEYLGVLEKLRPEPRAGGRPDPLRNISIVLLRIENAGWAHIRIDDYESSVRVRFPGREVIGVAVTDFEGADVDRDLTGAHKEIAGSGIQTELAGDDGVVFVPPVALRRGDHYKILAVLRGRSDTPFDNRAVDVEARVADARARQTRARPARLSLLNVWVWRGLAMSMGLIVLAAAEVAGDRDGMEIAAVAAASVPVVGSAVVAVTPTDLGKIANADLRRTLLIAQMLAGLGVIGFAAAVVLGVAGLGTEANAVYAALSGATLGSVSLVVAQRASSARRLALTLDMVNSIEDPHLRDRTRAQVALTAAMHPIKTTDGDQSTALPPPSGS